jgi:hypothetical protein
MAFKAMIITLVIFALIMVVAYFARPKITNWRTYAVDSIGATAHERSAQGGDIRGD